MYDYTLEISIRGRKKTCTYQAFIRAAGIENEVMHGSPLSAGGTPQAQSVAMLAKEIMKADSVTVYFNGEAILGA